MSPTRPPPPDDDGGAARWVLYAALTVGTFVVATAFKQVLEHNEADVLVAARHAMDPTFVPGDWYLGLDIPYRAVFDVVAGTLARVVGLTAAAVLGRVLGIVCVAAALAALFTRLRVLPAAVVALLVVYARFRSVVAEEWIVGSFETKTFAYAAALGALASVMRGRFVVAAILSGLAVDLHVLVGTYAAGTLVAAVAWGSRDGGLRPRRLAGLALAFGVAALPGIGAIVRTLASGAGVDGRAAGEVYVLLRVPHHTYPPHWSGVGWVVRASLCFAVLAFGAWSGRRSATRFVARYALASAGFAAVGCAILASGRVDLLKFYWFRFPDAIWPLGAALVTGALISERVPSPRARRFEVAAIAASCLALASVVPACWRDATGLASSSRADPVYLRTVPEDLRAALLWLRDATPSTTTVLVDPFLRRAHLATERAQVVNFKTSPQSDRDLLEWARRLALLADVDDLRVGGAATLARLERDAYRLRPGVVARVAREFGAAYYVAAADHVLPYPVAFVRGRYQVYRIAPVPTPRDG